MRKTNDPSRFAADAEGIELMGKVRVTESRLTEQQERDNAEHDRILRELAKDPVR